MPDKAAETLVVGKITGVYGIKGWLKVYSWTQPRENIFSYPRLLLGNEGSWREIELEDGKVQGKNIVVKLSGCDTREQAELLKGKELQVYESDLEDLPDGEYYWRDLIGLNVTNREGQVLGVVTRLFETGANDVLVVKGDKEHLIPWVQGQFVKEVDLEAGTMNVDWDADF